MPSSVLSKFQAPLAGYSYLAEILSYCDAERSDLAELLFILISK